MTSPEEAKLEALAKSTMRTVVEVQALIQLIERAELVKKLRTMADELEKLAVLDNDLRIIANRLRPHLPNDPDKTPVY